MNNKAVVSLTTGLEDAEKVTVAFLVAVGAVETGRETVMFLTRNGVRPNRSPAAPPPPYGYLAVPVRAVPKISKCLRKVSIARRPLWVIEAGSY
jgi:peroxiredoxin family protein